MPNRLHNSHQLIFSTLMIIARISFLRLLPDIITFMKNIPPPFLVQNQHDLQELVEKLNRSPIVAVKAGGDKKPAIFISAGSHSTEHAGEAQGHEEL